MGQTGPWPDGLLTNEADFNYLHAEAAGMQLLRAGRNRTGISGERRADIWIYGSIAVIIFSSSSSRDRRRSTLL